MASVILTDEIITTKQILNRWKIQVSSDIMTIKELIRLHVEIEYHRNKIEISTFFLNQQVQLSLEHLIQEVMKMFREGGFFISVGGYEAKSLEDRVFIYRKTEVKFYKTTFKK